MQMLPWWRTKQLAHFCCWSPLLTGTLIHTHTHTHTHTNTHTHTHTHTHTLTHSLTHSLTHTLTHSLTHSHTHSHTPSRLDQSQSSHLHTDKQNTKSQLDSEHCVHAACSLLFWSCMNLLVAAELVCSWVTLNVLPVNISQVNAICCFNIFQLLMWQHMTACLVAWLASELTTLIS